MNPSYYLNKNVIFGCTLLVIATFISFIYTDNLRNFSGSDFNFEVQLFSVDNLYNEETERFGGEVISKSTSAFNLIKTTDAGYEVGHEFSVLKPNDEVIFAINRRYGVNKYGKHVLGLGDKNRTGYLFGPENSNDSTFLYWHINYDRPLTMELQGSENIYGLKVNRYKTYFTADQSKELSALPGVPEERGVELDVVLELWIEPELGAIIKYEDFATAWYYSQKTKERIHPWNAFHNEYRTASIIDSVRKAQTRLLKIDIFGTYLPLLFIILFLVLLLSGFRVLRIQLAKHNGTVMGLAVLLIGLPITWIISNTFNENAKLDYISQLESTSQDVVNSIGHEVDICTESIEFLRYQYQLSDSIDSTSFAQSSKRLMERTSSIRAISWVPEITHEQRDWYEQRYLQGKPILQRKALESMHPTEDKERYYPVSFIYPVTTNASALGYDISSRPATEATLQRAKKTNSPSCSPPINLVQDSEKTVNAVILMNPLRNSNNEFTGVVNAVISTQNIEGTALSRFSINQGIALEIWDVTEEQPQILFERKSRLFDDESNAVLLSKNLPVKGRIWQFKFYYPGPKFSLGGFYIFLGGLAFTLVLAYLVFKDQSTRRRRLEQVNVQLENYSEKLNDKNKDLEQFIFIASHDLQEPTQSIRGFINLLKDEESEGLSETGATYIDFIKNEVNRMHSLVKALGDYIRIGKSKDAQEFDMVTQVKLALVQLKPEIEDLYPKITIENLPMVYGVDTEIQVVWYQLLSNAFKFRNTQANLNITISSEEKDNEYIFHIQDNGLGIAAEHHHKIFEIFRRLHLREQYSGSGMGLAICKKAIEEHGGKIWVKSKPGFGSTFSFSLPKRN